MKITKDMLFTEILRNKENSGEIMAKYGLHCVGCMMAKMESLEQGCKAHGLSDDQIEEMVKEINKS